MRPKNTYTNEEYKQLLDEVYKLKRELALKEQELYNVKFINKIINDRIDDAWRMKLRRIISEEIKTQSDMLKKYRKPYYKDIVTYVDMGITDIKVLASAVNKSESTVRRALQDMNMYPLKRKDFSKSRMNI